MRAIDERGRANQQGVGITTEVRTSTPPTFGTVPAADEKSAIAKAAETFNIGPQQQNKIVVTKLDTKGGD